MSFHHFYEYPLSRDDSDCLRFLLHEYLEKAKKSDYVCRTIKDFVYFLLMSGLNENETLNILTEAIFYLPRVDILYECSIKYDDYKSFEYGKLINMKRILLFKLFNGCDENEFEDFIGKFPSNQIKINHNATIFEKMEYLLGNWQNDEKMNESIEFLKKFHTQSEVPQIIIGYYSCDKTKHYELKLPNVVESKDRIVAIVKGDESAEPKFMCHSERGPKNLAYDRLSCYPYPEKDEYKSVCLIFNIRNYINRPRRGTEFDVESIRNAFGALHFSIQVIEDPTKDKMFAVANIYSKVDIEKAGAMFVCFILAHGEKDSIFDIDEKLVNLRELSMTFSAKNCESYRSKPKIFFINACQGQNYQEAVKVNNRGSQTYTTPQTEQDGVKKPAITQYKKYGFVPEEADFVMGMSTVPNCVAFRSVNDGSWYITEVCKAIVDKANKSDLVDILTTVTYEVSQKIYGKKACQLPIFCSTLMKKCYLTIPKEADK